jgi:hypothetical protein
MGTDPISFILTHSVASNYENICIYMRRKPLELPQLWWELVVVLDSKLPVVVMYPWLEAGRCCGAEVEHPVNVQEDIVFVCDQTYRLKTRLTPTLIDEATKFRAVPGLIIVGPLL